MKLLDRAGTAPYPVAWVVTERSLVSDQLDGAGARNMPPATSAARLSTPELTTAGAVVEVVDVVDLRARVAVAARLCAGHDSTLRTFTEAYPGGRRRAAMLLDPAFVELVQSFAQSFHQLTALVDETIHAACPIEWRSLIENEKILTALEAGLAAERRHLEARALKSSSPRTRIFRFQLSCLARTLFLDYQRGFAIANEAALPS